jgi:hypothetical protein
MAYLKQDDFAETCGQKSIFPLLAKSSTEGGATQLSLRLGHSDWPVKLKPPGKGTGAPAARGEIRESGLFFTEKPLLTVRKHILLDGC